MQNQSDSADFAASPAKPYYSPKMYSSAGLFQL